MIHTFILIWCVVTVRVPACEDFASTLAWTLSEISVHLSEPTPAPTPLAITVGGKCPKCVGGWLDGDRDGVYDSKCHWCGGDGIVHAMDPILVPAKDRSIVKESPRDYFVLYSGKEYIWNKERNLFETLDKQRTIKPPSSFNIEVAKTIQICNGEVCKLYQIQTKD